MLPAHIRHTPSKIGHPFNILEKDPGTPLSNLVKKHNAILSAKKYGHAKHNYITFDETNIPIKIYADSAFQNIQTKHSQTGFIMYYEVVPF